MRMQRKKLVDNVVEDRFAGSYLVVVSSRLSINVRNSGSFTLALQQSRLLQGPTRCFGLE